MPVHDDLCSGALRGVEPTRPIEVESFGYQLLGKFDFVILNGLHPRSGQVKSLEFECSAADAPVRRIPAFPTTDDAQHQNVIAMQGQRRGEVREHLVLAVRKGTRNQQQGA